MIQNDMSRKKKRDLLLLPRCKNNNGRSETLFYPEDQKWPGPERVKSPFSSFHVLNHRSCFCTSNLSLPDYIYYTECVSCCQSNWGIMEKNYSLFLSLYCKMLFIAVPPQRPSMCIKQGHTHYNDVWCGSLVKLEEHTLYCKIMRRLQLPYHHHS